MTIKNNARFDYPYDSHWNELGHGVAAESVLQSDFFINGDFTINTLNKFIKEN